MKKGLTAALPDESRLTIGFAHAAYQFAEEFRSRGRGTAY
jgi:hypothetical protein